MGTESNRASEHDIGAPPPDHGSSHHGQGVASRSRPTRLEPPSPEDLEALDSAFSSLDLPDNSGQVTIDTCLVHLKLLAAFQTLKEEIEYEGELGGISDSRAEDAASREAIGKQNSETRQKRWSVFVARAVDRYEAWWNSPRGAPLTELDMASETSPKYASFTDGTERFSWGPRVLPPLDVLLVWHSHMLNPKDYLEDCLRSGLRGLWTSGMPWKLVNRAIDSQFTYTVDVACMAAWESLTGRKWARVVDAPCKSVKCPSCFELEQVLWTTWGLGESDTRNRPGQGYCDDNLKFHCSQCITTMDKPFLELSRFIDDFEGLLTDGRPMPGTILDKESGMQTVDQEKNFKWTKAYQRTFPNRLVGKGLKSELLDLLRPDEPRQCIPRGKDIRG